MTLIRRCDGCGKDIDQKDWLELRMPKRMLALEFHSETCIELWLRREH